MFGDGAPRALPHDSSVPQHRAGGGRTTAIGVSEQEDLQLPINVGSSICGRLRRRRDLFEHGDRGDGFKGSNCLGTHMCIFNTLNLYNCYYYTAVYTVYHYTGTGTGTMYM